MCFGVVCHALSAPLVEKLIQNETGKNRKREFMKGEFRYV